MLKDERETQSGDVLTATVPRHPVDLIAHPACVIDRARRIRGLNPGATQLLGGGEQLSVRAGRLHCAAPGAVAQLERYLEQPGSGDSVLQLRLERRAGRDMLIRVERSAASCPTCDGDTARFLVHMFLPTDHWLIPEELLRSTYGFTAGEARVIHGLLMGARVSGLARELDLSAWTVRTHLKHAMRKLEVTTQMQLVQVLASGPWR